MLSTLVGGVELGGTKIVCAVAPAGSPTLHDERVIPTTSPDETLTEVASFFSSYAERLTSLGIASFGPLELDRSSPNFGSITSTPKAGWSGVNVRARLQRALAVPVSIHTEVIGAAIAEYKWGAAQHSSLMVYLTVGTGIGGAALFQGVPVQGAAHAEMGHVRVERHSLDAFDGVCPFHRDCLEGLASAPAIEARWGRSARDLPDEHRAWEIEAHYVGTALSNLVLTLAPERIVVGGGVLHRAGLLERVHGVVRHRLNGYLAHPVFRERLNETIVAPMLGDRSGVLGALCLATEFSPHEQGAASSSQEDGNAQTSGSTPPRSRA
ncbi:MAG: ROK family protein [Polyangiaceae bacterium]